MQTPRRYRSDGWQSSTGLGGSLHMEWVAGITGIRTGGHAWQILPFLGVIYGFVAGAIYSIGSYLYRDKRDEVSLLVASMLGLLASACTVPILVVLTVQLSAALLFAAIAGPVTGIVANFIIRRKNNYEANS